MNSSTLMLTVKKLKGYADWKLLLFLLLFLNVKLAVKVPAIALIYLLQFDFRFGFKLKNPRLPLFYLFVIVIAVADLLINKSYQTANYPVVLSTGIVFWLLCILAIHQVKLSIEKNDITTIHHTIVVFFLINTMVSLFNLGLIILETGAINPYTYQGEYQKYFIGTGDYIKGLTFDTSTTNAVLNAFGVIYFLDKKNVVMLLVCMAILLLTGSNFTNLALVIILALIFLFNSSKDQKSMIVLCLVFLVVFMAKISPQNNRYAGETVKNIINSNKIHKRRPVETVLPIRERPDSLLNPEEKREKFATLYLDSVGLANRKYKHREQYVTTTKLAIADAGRIYIPKPDINTPAYQNSKSTPPEQQHLAAFIRSHKTALPLAGKNGYTASLPGKAIGLLQTMNFLKQHPTKLLTGAGMGNFSSKLAFRVSGLGIVGGYPKRYTYINPDFEANHLDLYLNFFSQRAGFHSLTNSPFSVYDQLLAEFGVLGLLVFIVYYLGFFAKHYKTLTYGLYVLLLTTIVLFIDYWFEQLSILVFFELMLLLNIKETAVTPPLT
jgi:hypothetical protein